MPTVTGLQVITRAFRMLNISQPGDTIALADTADALDFLNMRIGQLAQKRLTIPAEARNVFPLIANKGSSTNPYSIGPGGDLNMAKPPNQASVTGAGLLLNISVPPVELPRGMLTNDAYDRQRIKDLPSTLFTDVFYLPTFAGGLGQIYLWPVPTDLTNSLVLYTLTGLTTFADLTTIYSVPDGYDELLYTQLMLVVAIPFGRTLTEDQKTMARESFNTIARSNIQLSDLENDLSFLGAGNARSAYNIQTGE